MAGLAPLNNPKVYRTVAAIADRLGVSCTAVQVLHRDYGLPIYRMADQRSWQTTEEALLDWQWVRARLDREFVKLTKAWGDEPFTSTTIYGRARYRKIMERYRTLTADAVGKPPKGSSALEKWKGQPRRTKSIMLTASELKAVNRHRQLMGK